MQEQIVLVKAARDILLHAAIISKSSRDVGAYRTSKFIQQGTVGIIEGDSKRGCEYRAVSFEEEFLPGFVTGDVRLDDLIKL